VDVSTGCRDKSAAQARLTELTKQQEQIRAGVITASEVKTAKHGRAPLADVIAAYGRALADKQRSGQHVAKTMRYLERAAKAMDWRTLANMDGEHLVAWIAGENFGARTANYFVVAFKSFATWAARKGYQSKSPFAHVERRNEGADRRHLRRPLSVDELHRLFEAARLRPIQEALRTRREASPETLDAARWLGETRAMAYWTAAATGLRWGELRSITLGAVRLEATPPHIALEARHEKARKGATLPVPESLAAGLRDYIVERRKRLSGHSRGLAGDRGTVVVLPSTTDNMPLFDVPESMSKIFHRDCAAAGIERCDSASRVVDVHSLRGTFATQLARAGVSLQVAQRLLRHSDPKLTANAYTHLTLVDTSDAVNKLPSFGVPANQQAVEKASNLVTPTVTPKSRNACHLGASAVNSNTLQQHRKVDGTDRISTNNDRPLQEVARKKESGPGRGRTYDQVIMSHLL